MNVVFDLGGVVLTWHPASIVASAFEDRRDRALAIECIFGHEDWQQLDRGLMDHPTAMERAVERTGLPLARVQELFQAIPRALVPLPASVGLVAEVRKAGHPVYALSNLHRTSLERIECTTDIFDLFDGRVVSCEVGACKPEPAIYQRLLDRFGLDPSSTIFIDDIQVNLDAAATFGMRTVLFTGVEACRRDLQSLGVHLTSASS